MYDFFNLLYYYWKRSNWMINPVTWFSHIDHISIIKPIFFVGHQGNGSTLVSRTFRRIDNVVTVTGGHEYFTGADEMQSVMGPVLPSKFTGIIHKVPNIKDFSRWRGWTYACNELLPYYKFSEYDYKEAEAIQFKKVIKLALKLHAGNKDTARFLDKSQSYALKIPLINEIFKDTKPQFIAIFRNPYAACWRSAFLKTGLSNENLNTENKLRIACEHWSNSFQSVIEQKELSNVYIKSIEEILMSFEQEMYHISKVLELNLKDDHFPQKDDHIPFGSKRRERWYPVKTEINKKYLKQVPDWATHMIADICRNGINHFNYSSI